MQICDEICTEPSSRRQLPRQRIAGTSISNAASRTRYRQRRRGICKEALVKWRGFLISSTGGYRASIFKSGHGLQQIEANMSVGSGLSVTLPCSSNTGKYPKVIHTIWWGFINEYDATTIQIQHISTRKYHFLEYVRAMYTIEQAEQLFKSDIANKKCDAEYSTALIKRRKHLRRLAYVNGFALILT
jgi:hypothetical protein